MKKLIYVLFFIPTPKKVVLVRAQQNASQEKQQTTTMADGTEANTTTNMETEPSEEEMDNETYDEILATFVLAKMRSDGGKATTVTPTPIPVWAATVATQTRRGRHEIRRRDLEILGGNNLHFGGKSQCYHFLSFDLSYRKRRESTQQNHRSCTHHQIPHH